MIIKYDIFENIQKAKKEFPDFDSELLNYINSKLKNKHYVYLIVKNLYEKSKLSTIDKKYIDNYINELEYYLDTNTYLTIDLDNNYYDLYLTLKERNNLLKRVKSLMPKNFIKNNKDLRMSFFVIKNNLEYLMTQYSLTANKNQKTRQKIDSVISASNKSIDELTDLFDDKYQLDSYDEMLNKSIFDDIEKESNNLILEEDIVWTNEDKTKFVVKIDSPEAMMFIGCNTSWCHSYKDAEMAYKEYTYYGKTYVLLDYTVGDDLENICVLTNKFFDAFYNDELTEWINIYKNDPDEYDNLVNSGELDEIIHNRHNDSMSNFIPYLFNFFDGLSMEEIENIFDL